MLVFIAHSLCYLGRGRALDVLRSALEDLYADNNRQVVTLGPGRKAMLFKAARFIGRTGLGLSAIDSVRFAGISATFPAVPGYDLFFCYMVLT